MGAPTRGRNVVLKFQSALVAHNRVIRMAFPSTPWVFLFRKPDEVMASLLYKVRAPGRWLHGLWKYDRPPGSVVACALPTAALQDVSERNSTVLALPPLAAEGGAGQARHECP